MATTSDPQAEASKLLHASPWRLAFILGVILVLVVYGVRVYGSNHQFVSVLHHLSIEDLLGVLILGALYVFWQSILLKEAYEVIGAKRTVSYSFSMFLLMNMVNTVAPAVGLSGPLYLMLAEQQNLPRLRAILVPLLVYLVDYLVFLGILALTFFYLIVWGHLAQALVAVATVLVVLIAILAGGGLFLFSHTKVLVRWLRATHRWTKRWISQTQIQEIGEQGAEAWKEVKANPRPLFIGGIYIVITHLTALSLFALSLHAFNVPISAERLLTGYLIGTLLSIVSITPAGLGFAEGGLVATLSSTGVPVQIALLVSVLYRIGIVLVPLALSLPALRWQPRLAARLMS